MISSRRRLVLVATATISLAACATAASEPAPRAVAACPPYPVAGPAVADELERLPASQVPALWEWFGRLDRFRDQLEAVR